MPKAGGTLQLSTRSVTAIGDEQATCDARSANAVTDTTLAWRYSASMIRASDLDQL